MLLSGKNDSSILWDIQRTRMLNEYLIRMSRSHVGL